MKKRKERLKENSEMKGRQRNISRKPIKWENIEFRAKRQILMSQLS